MLPTLIRTDSVRGHNINLRMTFISEFPMPSFWWGWGGGGMTFISEFPNPSLCGGGGG